MLTLLFKLPAVTPSTDEQFVEYQNLQKDIQAATKSFIPAIPAILHRFLNDENVCARMKEVRDVLGDACHARIVGGFASILFFMKEVLAINLHNYGVYININI